MADIDVYKGNRTLEDSVRFDGEPPSPGLQHARRRFAFPSLGRNNFIVIYSFFVSQALLFNGLLSSVSTAVLLFIAIFSPFLFWAEISTNRNVRISAILVALAFISAIWSNHPGTTIYYSVQLLLTFFLAASLASFNRPDLCLNGLFYSYVLFATLSIPVGQSVLWEDGQYVFVGLSNSKNNYGAMNFFVCLLGLYMFHQGLIQRRYFSILIGLYSLLLGFIGCLLAKATGAFLSIFLGCSLYFGLAVWGSLSLHRRIFSLALLAAFSVVFAFILSVTWKELSEAVLTFFNKSSDLTGRTSLWFVADRLIDQRFWLGLGQYAFWVPGDPAPEALWSEFSIMSKRGFNFHNSYREIMVHLGAVGIFVYCAVFAILIVRQLRNFIFTPRGHYFLYFAVLCSLLVRVPVESELPLSPVNGDTVFFIVALSMRDLSRRPRKQGQRTDATQQIPYEVPVKTSWAGLHGDT